MSRRDPVIADAKMLGTAKRMLRAHDRYRKVGNANKPITAGVCTAVENWVMQLTLAVPQSSPKKRVPHTSSRDFRSVIIATTRSGSQGRISKRIKKQKRNEAFRRLVTSLDYLDSGAAEKINSESSAG